jgi:hypothetical protein
VLEGNVVERLLWLINEISLSIVSGYRQSGFDPWQGARGFFL